MTEHHIYVYVNTSNNTDYCKFIKNKLRKERQNQPKHKHKTKLKRRNKQILHKLIKVNNDVCFIYVYRNNGSSTNYSLSLSSSYHIFIMNAIIATFFLKKKVIISVK